MEPISLILTALAAGVTGGALDALKDEVKDKATAVYEKLRGLAGKRIAGRPHGELALAEYPSAPEKWEGLLKAELAEAGAAKDDGLVAAAEALLDLIDKTGSRSGKYNVTIKDSRGVQVGDGNFQVNSFRND